MDVLKELPATSVIIFQWLLVVLQQINPPAPQKALGLMQEALTQTVLLSTSTYERVMRICEIHQFSHTLNFLLGTDIIHE